MVKRAWSIRLLCYLLIAHCCMILFLHGQDDFLVGRRKRALIAAFTKKYTGADVFIFDFEDQGSTADVKRSLEACEGGLFTSEKIVVFLHPFVLGELAQKMMQRFLQEQATALPEKTILLFVHVGKLKKTDILTKALLSVMDKEEVYDPQEGRALGQMVSKELALLNEAVSFDEVSLAFFLSQTGGDMARTMTELEKLATFKGAGVLTKEDIELLLTMSKEQALWGALDALSRGARKEALFLFRKEADSADGVFALLSMCAWQIRRLLLVREAYDQGIRRPSDVAATTKLPPFTVQKAMAHIEQFPVTRLKQGLSLLSDIDTALKQGKADPEASLDLFVWKF